MLSHRNSLPASTLSTFFFLFAALFGCVPLLFQVTDPVFCSTSSSVEPLEPIFSSVIIFFSSMTSVQHFLIYLCSSSHCVHPFFLKFSEHFSTILLNFFIQIIYVSPFFQFIYFNQRIITLQYYDDFCHTSTWISHKYPHFAKIFFLKFCFVHSKHLPPFSSFCLTLYVWVCMLNKTAHFPIERVSCVWNEAYHLSSP